MTISPNALSILNSPTISGAWDKAASGIDIFPIGKYVCIAVAELLQPSGFELKIAVELIVDEVITGEDYAVGMMRREYLPITEASGNPSAQIFKAKSLIKKLDPDLLALPLAVQVESLVKAVDGSKKVIVDVVKSVSKKDPSQIYTNYNIIAFTKEEDGSKVAF